MNQDIILSVDYHDRQCVIRRLDRATGRERVRKVPTDPLALIKVVEDARAIAAPRGGRVVWIQESTTGWARVKDLLGDRVEFLLANVLQMPLPPKAFRRKTDKVDTSRIQREYLTGTLPLAYQPPVWWRQVRRVVAMRENLVARRTALSNWIDRYLAHETWGPRGSVRAAAGRSTLRARSWPDRDGLILEWRLQQLELIDVQLREVCRELQAIYNQCPDAQQIDVIRGLDVVSSVSLLARIGPITRFRNAEHLVSYAGLAPGVQQSDQTRRSGRIGGGGTDCRLRHYVLEAAIWARQLPRYSWAYERVQRRRGNRVARLHVARLLLRSLYKVLRDQVPFNPRIAEVKMA